MRQVLAQETKEMLVVVVVVEPLLLMPLAVAAVQVLRPPQ
jgi:hypothetical protein